MSCPTLLRPIRPQPYLIPTAPSSFNAALSTMPVSVALAAPVVLAGSDQMAWEAGSAV